MPSVADDPKVRAARIARALADDLAAGRIPQHMVEVTLQRIDAAAAVQKYVPWERIARDDQKIPDGDWLTWLLLGGRGAGKTRTGSETAHQWARTKPRGALIAPTTSDVRDVMIEGESGILATAPPGFRPRYVAARRRVEWPNGAIATTYSAEEPERLRGPQHGWAWCDELAAYPQQRVDDLWSNLLLGLRLGSDPRIIVTTTPKPTQFVIGMVRKDPTVFLTKASTYDNLDNLAPTFKAQVIAKYAGTRVGRQELLAELLEDVEGALWTLGGIEADRADMPPAGSLVRVAIGVDPAVTSGPNSDETGIIIGGRTSADWCPACGPVQFPHAYVWRDASGRYSPDTWARGVVGIYEQEQADAVVAEVNNGGDLVPNLLRTVDSSVRVKTVRATQGKRLRAEPVAALAEQHRVHHVRGADLTALEEQLTTWTQDSPSSPDRLDAYVWLLTDLLVTGRELRPAQHVRT